MALDTASRDASENSTPSHMDLLSEDFTMCRRCGHEYNHRDIEPPENATLFWEPLCPNCNAKFTANTVDEGWLEIVGSGLDSSDEKYEERRERLHAQARLYHGRMSGYSVAELIRRAKWFDRQATVGRAWGPRRKHDVAFSLRQQAREKLERE